MGGTDVHYLLYPSALLCICAFADIMAFVNARFKLLPGATKRGPETTTAGRSAKLPRVADISVEQGPRPARAPQRGSPAGGHRELGPGPAAVCAEGEPAGQDLRGCDSATTRSVLVC